MVWCIIAVNMPTRKTGLEDLAKIEVVAARELANKRKTKKHRQYPEGGGTRIAKDVRAKTRLPPPVPGGKSLKEIQEMDPDDPAFKHPDGAKRKHQDTPNEELSWKSSVRKGKQRRTNERRARARKAEAVITKAVEVLGPDKTRPGQPEAQLGIASEDRLIAEKVITLEDWDDEELARGYRRGRNGKFGSPPHYIPREVQQEAQRRIVKRGEKKLFSTYLTAVDTLRDLAGGAESEKVRLDAAREIMDRTAGKVPDHLKISPDAPYQDILADSLVPVSEMPPLDLEPNDEGVLALPSEGVVDAPVAGGQEAAPEARSVDAPAPSISSPQPGKSRKSATGAGKTPPKRSPADSSQGKNSDLQVDEDRKAAAKARAAQRAKKKAAETATIASIKTSTPRKKR